MIARSSTTINIYTRWIALIYLKWCRFIILITYHYICHNLTVMQFFQSQVPRNFKEPRRRKKSVGFSRSILAKSVEASQSLRRRQPVAVWNTQVHPNLPTENSHFGQRVFSKMSGNGKNKYFEERLRQILVWFRNDFKSSNIYFSSEF